MSPGRVPAARIDTMCDGDVLTLGGQTWTAMHVPGHASMLAAFYAPASRTLLSADMLLARTPTPVFEPRTPWWVNWWGWYMWKL